jgi:hypothetical protein
LHNEEFRQIGARALGKLKDADPRAFASMSMARQKFYARDKKNPVADSERCVVISVRARCKNCDGTATTRHRVHQTYCDGRMNVHFLTRRHNPAVTKQRQQFAFICG